MHVNRGLWGAVVAAVLMAATPQVSAAAPGALQSKDPLPATAGITESAPLLLADRHGTRSAPIEITAQDAADAVQLQMHALRKLGGEQHVAWRVRSQTPVDPLRERTVRTSLDVVGVVDDQIVSRQESVYFRFSGLPVAYSLTALPAAAGFHDPRSGLRLPYQLGWLHLEKSEDNEQSYPGYGWSVYYGSAGMKATVYVYDLGQRLASNEIEQRRVQDEFDSVLSQITTIHKGAKLGERESLRDQSGRVRWLLASALLPDQSSSVVALTVRGGFFVKIRISWEANEAVDEMATESLAAIMSAVH